MPAKATPPNDDKKMFTIGTTALELFFSYAVQRRLTRDVEGQDMVNFLQSNQFSYLALGLLVLGRQAIELAEDDILATLEEMGLSSEQGAAITAWVREKMLNFILSDQKHLQTHLTKIVEQTKEFQATLAGIKV